MKKRSVAQRRNQLRRKNFSSNRLEQLEDRRLLTLDAEILPSFDEVLASGSMPLSFAEIATFENNPSGLRDRLDALDDQPGNVILTRIEGEDRFLVRAHVVVDSPRTQSIQVGAANGEIQLNGTASPNYAVNLDFQLGIDSAGAYLIAEADQPVMTFGSATLEAVDITGRIGVFGVEMESGAMTLDGLSVSFHEPLGSLADGRLRLDEIAQTGGNTATSVVNQDVVVDDVTVTGTFDLASFDPAGAAIDIGDATLSFAWPEHTNIGNVNVSAVSTLGQSLLVATDFNAQNIVDGLVGISQQLASRINATDAFTNRVPFLNSGIGQILSDSPMPITFSSAEIVSVSATTVSSEMKEFTVHTTANSLFAVGLQRGDTVRYRGVNGEMFAANVGTVTRQSFVVRFDQLLDQLPDISDPGFQVAIRGTLGDQLHAAFGDVDDLIESSETVQDLVGNLATRLNVNTNTLDVGLVGAGDDLAIEMSLPFDPDGRAFDREFEFDPNIPSLDLTTAGHVQLQIDAEFDIPIGIRIGGNESVGERFYVVDDSSPEATVSVTAQIDNPRFLANLGFLGVEITEDSTQGNQGIVLGGSFTVDLDDPGTRALDGRISTLELNAGHPSSLFDPALDMFVDIDGLQITPQIGFSSAPALPPISISLDGDVGGKMVDANDLNGIIANLQIGGLGSYSNFANITPFEMQACLNSLRNGRGSSRTRPQWPRQFLSQAQV